ncbi:MAG: FAD:protein FMN transferase [Lachnospiraceae bacterium]
MKFKKLIAFTAAFSILLSGCSRLDNKKDQTYTDTLFDTVISVQILDPVDKEVIDGCEKLCKEYDTKFSMTNEDSEIYKINTAKGKAVEVSDDTVTVIKKGIYYSELSKGAFDITIGAVSKLWDFHSEEASVPSGKKINSALSHVNYRNIVIRDNTVRLTDSKAALDVGAIAKGYIADRLKDYLKENDVKHAIINLGGNVQTIGTKTDGSSYNIGIQKPFDKSGQPITSVKVADKSVVTTGIYQRYFEKGEKLYHHILDPSTGYPCENTLYSVTIITNSSLTADALSTTCFLLGYDDGMKLVNQLDNVDAVFITNDNKIHYSENFMKKQ